MKNLLILFCLVLSSTFLNAQQSITKIDHAIQAAKEEGKDILIVFSGSDWCKPCIQLKKEILSQPTFQDFRDEHLVVLNLDFPYKKKNKPPKEQVEHNEKLANQYNPKGIFPYIVLLSAEQKTIGTISYQKNMTPEAFITSIKNIL